MWAQGALPILRQKGLGLLGSAKTLNPAPAHIKTAGRRARRGEGARAWGPALPPCLKYFLKAWQRPSPLLAVRPTPFGRSQPTRSPTKWTCWNSHGGACQLPPGARSGSQGNVRLLAKPSQGRQQGPCRSRDVPLHTVCPREQLRWAAGRQEEGTCLCFLSTCSTVMHRSLWEVVLGPDMQNTTGAVLTSWGPGSWEHRHGCSPPYPKCTRKMSFTLARWGEAEAEVGSPCLLYAPPG